MTKTNRSHKKNSADSIIHDKVYLLIVILTIALLTVPYIAMQFSDEVRWSVSDFVIMGVLLFGFGTGLAFVGRKVSKQRRLLIGMSFAAIFMYVWAELSVGVFFNLGS